jgi:hypothetical protein
MEEEFHTTSSKNNFMAAASGALGQRVRGHNPFTKAAGTEKQKQNQKGVLASMMHRR